MLLPKGKVLHENLSTSYTNLDILLHELAESGFTGYLVMSFWEYEAALFMERGNIINVVSETAGKKKIGQEAVDIVLNKAREKDGAISVYQLSEDMVVMLSGAAEGEAVHKNLTTEFSSLDKLIEKLKGENHTGYIEMALNNKSGNGIIFMNSGDPVEAIFSNNNDGLVQSGSDTLNNITKRASLEGAVFNVYKANLTKSRIPGHIKINGSSQKNIILALQEIISGAERVIDGRFKKGEFLLSFKKACANIAEKYPFIDPFTVEFEYKDGKINYNSKAELKAFISGVSEALNMTITDFSAKAAQNGIIPRIKVELQPLKERYKGELETFVHDGLLPQVFGAQESKVDRMLTVEKNEGLSARKGQVIITEEIVSEWEKDGITNVEQVKVVLPDGKGVIFKVSKEKSVGNKLKMSPADINSLKLQVGHAIKIVPE